MTRATKIELRLALFFAVVLGCYFLATYELARSDGVSGIFGQEGLFTPKLLVLCAIFFGPLLIFYSGTVIRQHGLAGSYETVIRDVREHMLRPDRLIARITVFAAWFLTMSIFVPFKFFIGRGAEGFAYDKTFAQWDRILFFGHDGWEITHRFFGTSFATAMFQNCYVLWFLLMWASIVWSMVNCDALRLRAQYMVSFMLSWIVIGSIAAYALASAGPCFYQNVLGDPHFAPLTLRLAQLQHHIDGSISSVEFQNWLWNGFVHRSTDFGMGISAMPSMHVAIAVLMALGAFRIGRPFGFLMSVYALLIWIGSIHLGWHYAVDGIVATFMMFAIWAFAGFVVTKIVAEGSVETEFALELEPVQTT